METTAPTEKKARANFAFRLNRRHGVPLHVAYREMLLKRVDP